MKHLSSISFLVLILGLSLFSISCGEDDPPTTATIKGTITIDNADIWADWADKGEVQLTIFPEFNLNPASGWGEVPDGTFGPGTLGGTYAIGAPYNAQNPIIFTYEPGKTQYTYELVVDPGTYSALALGFRNDEVTDPSLKTATLGVHHDNPSVVSHGVVVKIQAGPTVMTIFNETPPTSITVAAGDDITIDFRADFDFVNDWYM